MLWEEACGKILMGISSQEDIHRKEIAKKE
jgi:hypothetical protein